MTKPNKPPDDIRNLPGNVDVEKLVLGSALLDSTRNWTIIAGALTADDFLIRKHTLIFQRMLDLSNRGTHIDRVTVSQEFIRNGELELVDGISYLVSLDNGLPQIYNIESYCKIISDSSRLRRFIVTTQSLHTRALLQEDPELLYSDAARSMLEFSVTQDAAGPTTLPDYLEHRTGGVSSFLDPSKMVTGALTGLKKVDDATGGLRPGELVGIGGRPGSGKTSLANNIALRVALGGNPVVIFSMEMSRDELFGRMLCAHARLNYARYRRGFLSAHERHDLMATVEEVSHAPLLVDDSASTSLAEMASRLYKIKQQHDNRLSLVVVDYLQQMKIPGQTQRRNRSEEVGLLSRGLKLLAREMAVPIIALSQVRRPESSSNPRAMTPTMFDLRESGSIEADCDQVWLLHRPEMYLKDREDLKGIAEIIVDKNRAGVTGKFTVLFLKECMRFENLAVDVTDEDGQ